MENKLEKMNKKFILGILAVALVVIIGIGLFNYLNKPPIPIPEGTLSVSEILENPLYDTEVEIYGKVSLLGELFCPCFELESEGEKVSVWYGLMVEDDGSERPPVSVEGINNGDWVIVSGELKSEGQHRSLNDFWASNIAHMYEVEIDVYEVEVGKQFSITLESNPTTGYQWQLAKPLDESILKFIDTKYKTLATEFPPPPGTGGIDIWTYEAVGSGTAEICLKYVRPWESFTPAKEQTFEIIVK